MIKGRDLIVFSDDWGRHPFSCQHIMQNFIPHNRVLWVNTIGMRNPRLCAYDIKRGFEKIVQWTRPQAESLAQDDLPENLTVINPFMVPFSTFPPVRAYNRRSVVSAVHKQIGALGFTDPIVIATLPNAADYAGLLGEKGLVYYCVDDFTKWPGVDRAFVDSLEKDLLDKADVVFASAEELCSKKSAARCGRPLLLPHGVDYPHFHEVDPEQCAAAFAPFARPVIGFFGAISPWLDFELILYAARTRRDWSFVFIGPADTDISLLEKEPNIHLLGKVSYAELPAYAVHFDVGTIPFSVNDLTVCVNPLKLLEYFACGSPVVSTDLPEVAKYGHTVSIGRTKEEYVACLERALAEENPARREERKRIAAENSWQSRAETVSRELELL